MGVGVGGLGGRQGVASWRKEAGEGQGCPGSGTFPFSNNKKPVLGVQRGAPPSAPPAGPRHIFQAPSTHLPALSCISCKHQHFLWGEGLAVLGGGGATPGGLRDQHTMAGPGLQLAPPTARAFPATQRNATLGENWMVR